MPHGNQQMGGEEAFSVIFFLLLLFLQLRHGNQLCSSQYHGWHHVLDVIITLKKIKRSTQTEVANQYRFIKIWRFGILLSIRGFQGMRGEGGVHKNYSILFVSCNIPSHQCHLKYGPFFFCSFPSVLSSCLLSTWQDYTITSLQQTLMHTLESIITLLQAVGGQWAGAGRALASVRIVIKGAKVLEGGSVTELILILKLMTLQHIYRYEVIMMNIKMTVLWNEMPVFGYS